MKANSITDRRASIEKAVKALKLAPEVDGDFAVGNIERAIDLGPRLERRPSAATPLQAAAQLEEFARALKRLLQASDALSNPAVDAINAAKHRRGVSWPPAHTTWSFMRSRELSSFMEQHYPQLAASAEEAAQALSASPNAGKPTGRRPDKFLANLTATAAAQFEYLTGRRPARGKSEAGPYKEFVAALFDIAEAEGSSAHYASATAQRRLARKAGG